MQDSLTYINPPSPSSVVYEPITIHNIKHFSFWQLLQPEIQEAIEVGAIVWPFRTNNYVISELINWSDIPNDPIFQLTFPQRGMLSEHDFLSIRRLLKQDGPQRQLRLAAEAIQRRHNPHPARQTANTPLVDGESLKGVQHKYPETILYFPAPGQTCHAYCSYCFRWPQFVSGADRMMSRSVENLVTYVSKHPEITDVLITGGDPLVMKTTVLSKFLEPLLSERLPHIATIRIGTKALSYWPFRFTTDHDCEELLRLFERIVASGRQAALMAHFSHPRELGTAAVIRAIDRVRATGALIRMQAPIIRHINDDVDTWQKLWSLCNRLGIVPYYMFVERDTGPRSYFEVPLLKAYRIFRDAYSSVSGLARTVRGPVMSTDAGKILVAGTMAILDAEYFCLNFIQARDPDRVGRPFLARMNRSATWIDDLELIDSSMV